MKCPLPENQPTVPGRITAHCDMGKSVFMLVSEILIDWRLFPNACNWFHM
ncbi:MAG: hypothetical protein ABSH15_12310 [Verrucomicrobiota bacterium]